MLSPQRLERLQGYLLEEQVNLRQQVDHLASAVQDVNVGLGNHMAEDATAAFDQAATVSLRRSAQLALEQVDQALTRMHDGTYGACERCHAEIDFARLKAIPHATLCMACQKLAEL